MQALKIHSYDGKLAGFVAALDNLPFIDPKHGVAHSGSPTDHAPTVQSRFAAQGLKAMDEGARERKCGD